MKPVVRTREDVEPVEFTDEMARAALQHLDAEEAKARSILANLEVYPPRSRRAIVRAYTRSLAQIARCKRILRQTL